MLLEAGHNDEAAHALDDGRLMAQAAGQERLGAWIDLVSTQVAIAAGDRETGERHAVRGMNVFIKLGNSYGTAHCQYRLGQAHLLDHHIDEAIGSLREALEGFRNCEDAWIENEVSVELANAYRRCGQVQDALKLQRIARHTYRRLGGRAQARKVTSMLVGTLFTGILGQRTTEPKGTGLRTGPG
ncbi:MAG: hypothetical protein L3K08_04605 [Thermoplasmata archaeon]|nr:hypothetical protein [Thermoplasmata archaeon]